MTKKGTPWWSIPAMIGAGVAGLTALGGVAINYATYAEMPKKVESVVQKNEEQDDALDDLKGWAKQIQGYTQAMNQQQAANQAAPVVDEVADDGEIKVLLVDGKKLCCDGTECWRWEKHDKCVRDE